jgi:hypothetical protein
VAAGCGSSSPSLTAGSDAASASVASTDKSSFDLAVGDCFDTEDLSALSRVTVVDCAGSHTYEVFGVTSVPAGASASFPGTDALNAAADAACRPDFAAYVGVDFNDSTWFGTFLKPSASTWATGDREIVCVLHRQDRSAVRGSAKGSAT